MSKAKKIRELHAQGLGAVEIAKLVGCSDAYVRVAARQRVGGAFNEIEARYWKKRLGLKGNTPRAIKREKDALRRKEEPEFHVWVNMRQRCNDPNCSAYRYYGGKGITVCDRWAKFANFIEDMGPRPTPKHILSRINDKKPYEPGNCQWTTWTERQNRRPDNRRITIDGKTMTLAQWCRELSVTRSQVYGRVQWHGWSYKKALLEAAQRIT